MMPSELSVLADDAPQRLHPLTLIFATVSIARRFLFPAIVGGISAGGDELGEVLRWVLVFLAVPAFGVALAKYLSFRYRIRGDELLIDSGLLQRKHRVIPLSRVQNIELRQTMFHTLCGVAELRVETAGAGETEAVLAVVDRDVGFALRQQVLDGRRRFAAATPETGAPAVEGTGPVRSLAHLAPRDLVLAGATANEAGLIAAVLVGGLQFLDDLPVRVPMPPFVLERLERLENAGAVEIVVMLAAGVLVLLLLGWLFSIAGSTIRYHDFTLEQSNGELRKRYGLLSRREASLPLERVQAIRIEESLLRRPLGLAAIKIESAGGGPGQRQRGGAEAFLPLARTPDVDRVVRGVFPELDLRAVVLARVHPRTRRRLLVRYLFRLFVVIALLTLALGRGALAALLVLPLIIALALSQYRNRGYALVPGFLIARRGVVNRITWLIPLRKVQTVHTREDPFQRRLGLATVIVDTAAGGRVATIADLGADAARDVTSRLAEHVPRAVSASGRRRQTSSVLGDRNATVGRSGSSQPEAGSA